MAQCKFSISFTGTASDVIKRAEAAIKKAEGEFVGDISSGSFSLPTKLGQIQGTYTMNGGSPLNVEISEKPFFVACNLIQEKLSGYLNSEIV